MTTSKPKQIEIAAALGVSPAAISQFKKQGMPTTSIDAARAWREQSRNPAQRKDETTPPAGQNPGDGVPAESFASARRRLMIAQADRADMETREAGGELIRVEAVRTVLGPRLAAMREHLLQIPDRLAPLLAAETDPNRVQDMLRDELHLALQTMAGPLFAASTDAPPASHN